MHTTKHINITPSLETKHNPQKSTYYIHTDTHAVMQSIKTHKHKPRQLVHVHTHTHTHTHYQEDFFSPLYSIYSFLHTESQYTIQLPTEYTGLYKYKDTYVHTHSCMGIYIQCQEMIFHLPLTCDNTWGAQIPLLKAVS